MNTVYLFVLFACFTFTLTAQKDCAKLVFKDRKIFEHGYYGIGGTPYQKKRHAEDNVILENYRSLSKKVDLVETIIGPIKRDFSMYIGYREDSVHTLFLSSVHRSIWGKLIVVQEGQAIDLVFADSSVVNLVLINKPLDRSFTNSVEPNYSFTEQFNWVNLDENSTQYLKEKKLVSIIIHKPHLKSESDEIFKIKVGKGQQELIKKICNCLLLTD